MNSKVTWFVLGSPGMAQVLVESHGRAPTRLLRMDMRGSDAATSHVADLLEHGARESMYDRLVLIAELDVLHAMHAKLGRLAESRLVMTSPRSLRDDGTLPHKLREVMQAN